MLDDPRNYSPFILSFQHIKVIRYPKWGKMWKLKMNFLKSSIRISWNIILRFLKCFISIFQTSIYILKIKCVVVRNFSGILLVFQGLHYLVGQLLSTSALMLRFPQTGAALPHHGPPPCEQTLTALPVLELNAVLHCGIAPACLSLCFSCCSCTSFFFLNRLFDQNKSNRKQTFWADEVLLFYL